MVLNRKSFFLELREPAPEAAETKSQPGETSEGAVAATGSDLSRPAAASDPIEAEAITSTLSAESGAKSSPSLSSPETTAAELAEADAARAEIRFVTFAPEALQPGNSVRPGKRRPGNNLSGFRSMATDLFKT